MMELDKKFELLPKLDFNIDKLNQKASQLGSQLQVVDTRLLSMQDNLKESKESEISSEVVLNKLGKIESELKNMSATSHN